MTTYATTAAKPASMAMSHRLPDRVFWGAGFFLG
jgi:hypothetical protein